MLGKTSRQIVTIVKRGKGRGKRKGRREEEERRRKGRKEKREKKGQKISQGTANNAINLNSSIFTTKKIIMCRDIKVNVMLSSSTSTRTKS